MIRLLGRKLSRRRAWERETSSQHTCNVCQNFECQYVPSFRIKDLDGSTGLGCASCSLLQIILQYYRAIADFDITIILWPRAMELRFCNERFESVSLELNAVDGTDCPWAAISYRSHKLAVEHIDLATKQIKTWLNKCNVEHRTCNRYFPSSLPSRVVEIRGPKEVRLHISSDNQYSRYACLSHCWGGIVPLRTIRTNLEKFCLIGIPWDALPLTFQDAIELTYQLGLRYIWIDSLCIVQDDSEDWRHEGSKMAAIYSGSHITLAATSAPNSRGGLYTDQNCTSDRIREFSIPSRDNDGKTYQILSRRAPTFEEHEALPLNERAWFFQERSLSRRIVHFADNMLYWGCSKQTINERGDFDGIARLHRLNLPDVGPMPTRLRDAHQPRGQVDKTRLARSWHTTVTAYTRLKLTYNSDRLPALQGIAKSMHQERKCAYYAGIWEDTLLRDVMWWRSKRESIPQDTASRAPSWSWASATGPVEWPRGLWSDTFRIVAEAVSVETNLVGQDSLGEVAGGRLVLSGRCVPIEFETRSSGWTALSTVLLSKRSAVWREDSGVAFAPTPHNLTMFVIGEDTYNSWGLMLRELDAEPGTFHRVGCAGLGSLRYRHQLKSMGRIDTITLV